MSKEKPCLLHQILLQFPPVRSQMHAGNGIQTPAISSKFHLNNPGPRKHQTLVDTARLWCRSYYAIIATTMIDCQSFTSKIAPLTYTHTHAHKQTNSQTGVFLPFSRTDPAPNCPVDGAFRSCGATLRSGAN